MSKKPRIEIHSKDVGGTFGLAQHLYILYIDSNGKEYIIAGGPEKRKGFESIFSMLKDELKITYSEYNKEHPDFQKLEEEKIKPRPSTLIYEGSDADAKISKMLSLLEKINAGQHDYKIPVPNWIRKVFGSDVAHCHNSNTVIRVLVEEAGLEFKLPVDKSGKEVNAICFDSEIKDTAFDKFLKSEEMTDEEIDIVTWELIALSAGGGAGGIALRVIGSRLYNWIKDALRERKKKDDNDPSDDEDDDLNSGGAVAASSMKAAKVVPTGPIIGKRELQEIIEESRAEVKIAEEEVREYYKEEANLGKNVLTEEEFQKKVLEHLQLKENAKQAQYFLHQQAMNWIVDKGLQIKESAGKLGKNFDELAIDYKDSIKSQQDKIQELKIAAGDELQKKLDVLLQEANESLKGAREANEKKMAGIKEEYNSKIKVLYDQINEKVEKEYRDQSAKLMQRLNDELEVANKAVYDDVNLRLRQGERLSLLQPEADRRTSENKAKYQMLYDQESKMILSSIMEEGESRAEAAEIKKLQQEANDKISAIHDLNKEAHAKFTQEYTSKKDELEAATIQMMHDQQKKIATEFEAMRHNLEVVLHERQDLNDAIKGLPEVLSFGIRKDAENYGLPGFQYYSSNVFNTKTLAASANDFVDDVSKSTFTLKDSHAETFTTQGFSPYTRGRFDFWKSAIDNSIFGTPIDYTKINYGQHEEGTRPLNSFEFDLYLKPLLGSIADYAGSSYEAFQDAFQSAKREFFSWSPRMSAADLAKLTVVGGMLIGAARFAASSTPLGMAAAAISSMMVIFKEKLAYATTHVSPIILDLNGDGVKTYNYKEGVYFDYDADDFAEKVGWISEEDGFLAIDLNGNGRIDNIRELFGNDFIPAYFKLELMDSNRDGVIDAKDSVFDSLLVWQDKNKNGYSEKSEIKTLRELGITSLSLQREKLNKIVNGNIFTDKSTFTYADGRTFEAIDVLFENDDMDSQYVGDPLENEIKIPESVYKLPNMNGFGVVPPLWIAMLKNKKLHQQVEDFVQLKPSEFSQIHIKSQEIIYEWTGVNEWSDDMSMTATGLNIDGRKVGVIEKFSGQPFRQLGIAKFVGQHASTALNEAYLMVLNQLVQNLLVQGLFKPIFKEAVYYGLDRTVRLNIGIDEILHRSKDYISNAKSYWSIIWDEGYDFWMQIGYILAANKVELSATVDSIRKKIKEISGYSIYIGEKEFELVGDDFDNVIVGGAASEVIKGLGGNDKLSGGAGDDLIDGGEGNDEIHGGTGRDRLYSGAGNDKIYGDEGRDFIYCGPGNDYAAGGAGDDNIEGGEGADEMDGGPGTDTLSYARSEAGVFINLASKEAGGGDAEGDKFKNFENIGGSEFDDELHGDDLPNHINGEGGNDKIYGGGGVDQLFGATGDDEIYGEDGDDFITGFSGIDKIDGGPGNDTVSYHHPYAISGVTVNLSTGKGIGGHAEGDTYQNIENILGSRHDDILIGDGNDNSIFGMEGDDEIHGGGGNDKIVGGSGYNILNGDDGDDVFWLGEGNNRIDGGSGSDTVDYSKAKHRVHASLSNNTSKIGRLFDDYYKNIENIAGSLFNDEIIGNNQDNKLFGLDGNDAIRGEGGNDVLVGGKGADFLDGGDGIDTADYSSSSESVIVNLEDGEGHGGDAEGDIYESIENIAGSLFDDEITGNDKDNKLFGLNGNDTIRGEGGNDILVGGRGADFLDGGDGIDYVSYFSSDTFVEVNLAAQVGKNGDAEGDRYLNIEGVIGSKYNDKITGSETRDFLDGREGDDEIYGGKGNDWITGGAGNNKLFGEEGDDIFFLEDGSNYVDGGASINTATYKNYRLKEWQSIEMIRSLYTQARLIADGVAKDFVLSFDSKGVRINLSTNNAEKSDGLSDQLFNIQNIEGSNFNDEIIGNDLNNYIIGLNGDDIISAGSGDDIIIPGNGTNKLYAEFGNDFIIAGDGRDYIDGGDGIDSITYRSSKDGIVVNLGTGECSSGDADGDNLTGIENIEGSNHRDIIYDSSDNNTIATGEDNDEIYLSNGEDIVAAGAGDDKIFMQSTGKKYLIGGDGSDKFIFSRHSAGTESKENLQVMIMDFAVSDHNEKIDLSRIENIKSFQDLQITQVFKSTKDLNIPEILIPSFKTQENLKFTVITLSETQTVFLYNVQLENLASDNFIFSHDPELIPMLSYSHDEL